MKRLYAIFFLSLFGWVHFASAQVNHPKDSLLLVKTYLLDIRKSLDKKQEKRQNITTLDSLINKGKSLDKLFQRGQLSNLSRSFHFILQSLALYKSDLKTASESPMEQQYLDENIPLLIKQIDNFRVFRQ